jgi:hypothetical protein
VDLAHGTWTRSSSQSIMDSQAGATARIASERRARATTTGSSPRGGEMKERASVVQFCPLVEAGRRCGGGSSTVMTGVTKPPQK